MVKPAFSYCFVSFEPKVVFFFSVKLQRKMNKVALLSILKPKENKKELFNHSHQDVFSFDNKRVTFNN